jgi:Transport and Golgi organisation 2
MSNKTDSPEPVEGRRKVSTVGDDCGTCFDRLSTNGKFNTLFLSPDLKGNVEKMCVVALALDTHPKWRIILAGNRDEFHARPSAPLARWDGEDDHIIAGRDLVAARG